MKPLGPDPPSKGSLPLGPLPISTQKCDSQDTTHNVLGAARTYQGLTPPRPCEQRYLFEGERRRLSIYISLCHHREMVMPLSVRQKRVPIFRSFAHFLKQRLRMGRLLRVR